MFTRLDQGADAMKSQDQIWAEWKALVNLTPAALRDWLETEESRSVGEAPRGGESTGHKSGRQIVTILEKHRAELDDHDWAHMARVVGYIKRHTAQGGPRRNREHSRWRYSLMNWGHDPLA